MSEDISLKILKYTFTVQYTRAVSFFVCLRMRRSFSGQAMLNKLKNISSYFLSCFCIIYLTGRERIKIKYQFFFNEIRFLKTFLNQEEAAKKSVLQKLSFQGQQTNFFHFVGGELMLFQGQQTNLLHFVGGDFNVFYAVCMKLCFSKN